MGLTSSQGRLLMLTGRLSDLEYGEILINQRQLQLATKSEEASRDYSEAINNKKLVMKVNDNAEEKGYRKDEVNYQNLVSMGYLITNLSADKLYLIPDEKGNFILPKASNLPVGEQDIFDGNIYEEDGKKMVKLADANGNGKVLEIVSGKDLIDTAEKVQNNYKNGVIAILNTTGNNTFASTVNQIDSNTSYEWVYDTSDDAEAEAKYEYATAQIARKDNQLTLDMKQLETEHNAVIKEMESVEKVIDNNIERTYKLFDA